MDGLTEECPIVIRALSVRSFHLTSIASTRAKTVKIDCLPMSAAWPVNPGEDGDEN